MEMAFLEARNMLPLSGESEVTVHVHKLTDSTSNAHCFNCGGSCHKGGMKLCPAQGKCCRCCNKLNHFAKFCRSVPDTPVHNLEQNDCTPDNSEINAVGKDNANFKLCHCVWTLEQRFLL
ncbi:hypothetical protein XELAEV_18005956mg [Xenopus laevis]|uniref:CCHC-type domain-containing protein n=1 Tax=Xenopus laevis TaxID=8355 RepID=A0A974DY90_XENLA|nr:hypothetical protein XELAEV_18005956mg [Xenopus laevis]